MRGTPPSVVPTVLLFTALVAAPAVVSADTEASSRPAFRLTTEGRWVHHVDFDRLVEAAPDLESVPWSDVRLTRLGDEVPILPSDEDAEFGPGDRFEFLADEPLEPGHANVFQLRLDGEGTTTGVRKRSDPGSEGSLAAGSGGGWVERRVLEEERLRVRLDPRQAEADPEIWFWHKLTYVPRDSFELEVPVHDVDRSAPGGIGLVVRLRGWSRPRAKEADHRVEVSWQGTRVGAIEWEDQDVAVLEVESVPWELVEDGPNRLELVVPPRTPEGAKDPLVDVVLLDRIELRIPRGGVLRDDQARLVSVGEGTPRDVFAPFDRELRAWGADGQPRSVRSGAIEDERRRWRLEDDAPSNEVVFVHGETRPVGVERDLPSRWRDRDVGAEYLVVAHGSLVDAVRPLAEFHRSRGLSTVIADVQDLYDEFGHGEPGAEPVRRFVRWAHERWPAPAPRFLLLVGDASWDPYSAEGDDARYADWTFQRWEKRRFAKNSSTSYDDIGSRQLVPTFGVATSQGPAASDNPYADLDDDGLPELAVGRFPVVEPAEVEAIVAKTIGYFRSEESGTGGDQILWVTNEQHSFQRFSDELAAEMAELGYENRKIYPSPEEADNALHQEALTREIGDGPVLVHFFGHGGRYIWRTGPPDLKKNHDLFTLEHLDALPTGSRLPVVLSMTCYSAPFDHPTADSIGEKFLRVPDRGAVAVFAASWRNSPTRRFSHTILEALHGPGTLGEAIVAAKREIRSPIMVETYNLLGDPALQLASAPRHRRSLAEARGSDSLAGGEAER